MPVVPGIEVLAGEHQRLVRGRKVAVLAHAASVGRDYCPAWELLARAGARVVGLLAPEHGLFAEAQDMEQVASSTQRVAGEQVPVRSLYGASASSLAPRRDDLLGADLLVVDLQDVGSRYYTFAATADMAASACLDLGVEVILADRPNPLGGVAYEGGPGIGAGYRSFVGHFDVPHRHGLTLGELVRASSGGARDRDGLSIVRACGWDRAADAGSSGLPWVMPSPNMPSLSTALVYPGACLVEGTALSEGRGTTRPFEIVGAPGLDGEAVARAMDPLALEGMSLRPIRFRPTAHKHAGKTCGGVFVHVTDPASFRPLRAYVALLWAVGQVARHALAWRTDTYEFRCDVPAIDLLWGGAWLREAIDAGARVRDLFAEIDRLERSWIARRDSHLLY